MTEDKKQYSKKEGKNTYYSMVLTPEIINRLDEIAKATDRKRSQVIRLILTDYIGRLDKGEIDIKSGI